MADDEKVPSENRTAAPTRASISSTKAAAAVLEPDDSGKNPLIDTPDLDLLPNPEGRRGFVSDRGAVAPYRNRWKNSNAANPLPYDPVENLAAKGSIRAYREDPRGTSMVSAALGSPKRGREARHSDYTRRLSPGLIRSYILYRLDPRTDRYTQRTKAAALGVSRWSISALEQIPAIFDEIRAARYKLNKNKLLQVDETVFATATDRKDRRHIEAARLVYERWDPEYVQRRSSLNISADLKDLENKSIEELTSLAKSIVADIETVRAVAGIGLEATPGGDPDPSDREPDEGSVPPANAARPAKPQPAP